MTQPKKLIEVAMPVKEISAESVRDKSIRHGHISTLHLWWARRPLPVCRAVVFASLVPDPLDPHCPAAFCDAVTQLLGKEHNPGDPYLPYDDIPYTSAIDQMEDNLRNRLLMFIGKFSEVCIRNEKQGKVTNAKDQLSDASLIKWDNKNNPDIIRKARQLIWVAYNAASGQTARQLLDAFTTHEQAIRTAEQALYQTPDRHLPTEAIQAKEAALQQAVEAFLDRMPRVFDPFAGGGAIPLEAARLGCRSYGNDINPVAHIIQKGSLEFPQKFGKPIVYTKPEFIRRYGEACWNQQPQAQKVIRNGEATAIRIANRLSFDVAFYARKLLTQTEKEIGHLYPADEQGNKPIAYYWVYTGKCVNPSCKADVPLLKQFYLSYKSDKKVYLKPIISDKDISFEIKYGTTSEETWIQRKNLKCPVCRNITAIDELKRQFNDKEPVAKLIAVIEEGVQSKQYRLPTQHEIDIIENFSIDVDKPSEKMPKGNSRDLHCMGWGIENWSDLFSPRQLYALQSLVTQLHHIRQELQSDEEAYQKAIVTYLGILVDRVALVNTSFGRWHISGEKIEHPFAKQAIPMMFDYPESNMFCQSTGSAYNQLEWLTRYIESECTYPFAVNLKNASSGDKSQFSDKSLTAVITDPPYYDAIAYADLSDFFYVWLKRTLGEVYPLNFATPQTPKSEECTALKHHHANDKDKAKHHFETKLTQIFDAIEHQTSDIVSIMFAHQTTEAWTTLCNAILGARMNITGSWSMDTEMANRSIGLAGAALESSVTVACKPTQQQGYGSYREVRKAIERTVVREVDALYRLGFRGADLLTACFGKAVSEFGQYARIEKADGSEVTVAELLEMARESAFNALLKGFDGDECTKFYIGWLQLYGFTESEFDDAAKFSRVGLTINVQQLFAEHILLKKGNKQIVGGFVERIAANKKLGEQPFAHLIDHVHRAMYLFRGSNRGNLLRHIAKVANSPDNSFWRVLTSLCEVLPADCEDHKQAVGLLTNRDSLIRESQSIQAVTGEQQTLFD